MSGLVPGALAALSLFVPPTIDQQTPATTGSSQGQIRTPGTTVTVVAQKEPADPATLPVSVTAIPADLLATAGVTFISDAAALSPNTHFTEFTARKLSNPRIRGIGASPANPGVVTYVDGVPQLNSNTSSFDLVGVDQVEFVRGPQSALFGRNALGGVINISSARPSLTAWGGGVSVPFGSDDMLDVRADISGPLKENTLAVGLALAFGRRDGFTIDSNGNDVDSREGFLARGQLLWTPNATWENRVIISGERARDGDYALADLDQVRTTPFVVARDFEGHTDRDVLNATIQSRYQGSRFTLTNTMGFLRWKTFDETDLDYSPLPFAVRRNREEANQFSDEVRLASPAGAPIKLGGRAALRWQAGALIFTQRYDQLATQDLAPFLVAPVAVTQTVPSAALDDVGFGLYGQGTVSFSDRFDVSAGLRFDRENRDANIVTSLAPGLAPDIVVSESRTFSDVSPQIAAAYRIQPRTIVYGTFSRAFKAGGFNPVSFPGDESFGEEHASNVEGGVKFNTSNGRFSASVAAFSIMWDDLQLNLPVIGIPAQFFIDNVGTATSRGVEIELSARAMDSLDVFGGVGVTRARFEDGSNSGGFDVSGNEIPNTPAYTALVGAQLSRSIRGHRIWGRIDVNVTGGFFYDDVNSQKQDAYTLTNIRVGFTKSWLNVEGWVRNAFDERYVPLAFAFPGFGGSGFLAEPGRPRTWGVSIGVRY